MAHSSMKVLVSKLDFIQQQWDNEVGVGISTMADSLIFVGLPFLFLSAVRQTGPKIDGGSGSV